MNVETFQELQAALREWRSFGAESEYDFHGMVLLLQACLDNLRQYALEVELDELSACLTDAQKEIAKKWCSRARPLT